MDECLVIVKKKKVLHLPFPITPAIFFDLYFRKQEKVPVERYYLSQNVHHYLLRMGAEDGNVIHYQAMPTDEYHV